MLRLWHGERANWRTDILSGVAPESLPFEIRTDGVPMFDWPALKRWGISESPTAARQYD